MSSRVDPLHRLVSVRRKLVDALMGRRLMADPERTGVVDMGDFGKRLAALATLAAESVAAAGAPAEEVELAARLAGLMETLPRTPQRAGRQCDVLDEALRHVEAAIKAEGALRERPSTVSLSVLARRECDLFSGLREIEGRLEDSKASSVDAGAIRRALRRALLDHGEGPFALSVDRAGTLRFPGHEFAPGAAPEGLPRSGAEPPEVKKALDLYEATSDPALRDFLMVKALDELVFAILAPRMGSHALLEKALALPRHPGKRMAVRPEVVTLDIPGWQPSEAASAVEKFAARRIGPEWARMPKAAYLLRLLLDVEDGIAADLLALGPALRRLEKGENVEGSGDRAEGALRGLLGLLG